MNEVSVLTHKTRLFEIDALRTFAIILVVFSHIDGYLNDGGPARVFDPYVGVFGLAIFFFISGYLLYLNNSSIRSWGDVVTFYKKRVVKIFPLYWIAVIAAVIAFGILGLSTDGAVSYNFSWASALVHAVGLQGFLGYEMPSLWFMSAILLYYALYPILAYLSGNVRYAGAYWLSTLVLILALELPFRSINFGIFLYYSVFVGGVMAGKIGLLGEGRKRLLPAFATLLMLTLIAESKLFMGGEYSVSGLSIQSLISILAFSATRDCLAISLSVVLYWTLKTYSVSFVRVRGLMTAIAYGSFATFLFHVIIFAGFRSALDTLAITGAYADACMYLLALPATFLLGYMIMRSFDESGKLLRSLNYSFNDIKVVEKAT
jgi:peptidoglycan/LPS O-acetylase OafA/YrhL